MTSDIILHSMRALYVLVIAPAILDVAVSVLRGVVRISDSRQP